MQAISSQSLGGRCLPVNKVAVRVPTGQRAVSRSSRCTVRAFFPLADIAPQVSTTASEVASQANKLNPGSVSAPDWVIPVAAILVTIGGGFFAFLLKPGADAAEKVFERDAKRLGNQAKAKAGQIKPKAKKAVKSAQRVTIRGGR